MRSPQVRFAWLMMIAFAMTLVACSDDDAGSDEPASTSTTAPVATTVDPGSGVDDAPPPELTFAELQARWDERVQTFPLATPDENQLVGLLDGLGEPTPIRDSDYWKRLSAIVGVTDPESLLPGAATVREGDVEGLSTFAVVENADGRVLLVAFATGAAVDPAAYELRAAAVFANLVWVVSERDGPTFLDEIAGLGDGTYHQVDGAYVRLVPTSEVVAGTVGFFRPIDLAS